MSRIRIVLADDHNVVREGLRLLLTGQPDMEVIGEADNGRAAVTLTQQLRPDVVVMDISMPNLNGLQATERISELCPETTVITLTRHSNEAYIQPLLEAGAKGYVLKQSASDELLRAVRAVAAGKKYLDPAVTEHFVGSIVRRRAGRHASSKSLSRREEQVLRLIASGLLNKEVAARLHISIKTAETHKANAMTKLGMASRVDIVRHAMLHGWLENE